MLIAYLYISYISRRVLIVFLNIAKLLVLVIYSRSILLKED